MTALYNAIVIWFYPRMHQIIFKILGPTKCHHYNIFYSLLALVRHLKEGVKLPQYPADVWQARVISHDERYSTILLSIREWCKRLISSYPPSSLNFAVVQGLHQIL